jgi:hypothetical protein
MPSIIRGRLALSIALLLAAVVAGCSAVKLGYNNAPSLGYWWLDSYLDFNEAQSHQVRTDLDALQAWHRQSELPLIANTLERLQRQAPANVTPDQLCEVYSDFKPRFQAVLDQTEPKIAALAPTLKPDQLEHLARQLEKRSVKWREEWQEGTATERAARRVKQMVERAEMLYGRLEEPQLAILRASVAASAFDTAVSHRESLRRHQDTVQTLRQLQSAPMPDGRARAEVRGLLSRSTQSPDPSYRSYQDKLIQENCRTFATLHNSTTAAQRVALVERLKNYETDARTLMGLKR